MIQYITYILFKRKYLIDFLNYFFVDTINHENKLNKIIEPYSKDNGTQMEKIQGYFIDFETKINYHKILYLSYS